MYVLCTSLCIVKFAYTMHVRGCATGLRQLVYSCMYVFIRRLSVQVCIHMHVHVHVHVYSKNTVPFPQYMLGPVHMHC